MNSPGSLTWIAEFGSDRGRGAVPARRLNATHANAVPSAADAASLVPACLVPAREPAASGPVEDATDATVSAGARRRPDVMPQLGDHAMTNRIIDPSPPGSATPGANSDRTPDPARATPNRAGDPQEATIVRRPSASPPNGGAFPASRESRVEETPVEGADRHARTAGPLGQEMGRQETGRRETNR